MNPKWVLRHLLKVCAAALSAGLLGGYSVQAAETSTTTEISDAPASTSVEDVVVKGFMPDTQSSRLVQDAMEQVRREKVAREKRATEEAKRAAAEKKRLAAEKAKAAEQAKAAAKARAAEKKTVASGSTKKAESASTTTAASVVTAKKSSGSEDKETVSATVKNKATDPKPGTSKPAVDLDKVNDKEITISESTSAGAAEKPEGQSSQHGRVVSIQPLSRGRIRVLIDSDSGELVQGIRELKAGERVPYRGARVSFSGKTIGGNEHSPVMRLTRLVSSGGSSNESRRRSVASLPFDDEMRRHAMPIPMRDPYLFGPVMHPEFLPPGYFGPGMPPPGMY